MTAYHKMNQQYREALMRALAENINDGLTAAVGDVCFTLIVWPETEGALSNYISNAGRAEMIKALRETADRLEQRLDVGPVIGGMQ